MKIIGENLSRKSLNFKEITYSFLETYRKWTVIKYLCFEYIFSDVSNLLVGQATNKKPSHLAILIISEDDQWLCRWQIFVWLCSFSFLFLPYRYRELWSIHLRSLFGWSYSSVQSDIRYTTNRTQGMLHQAYNKFMIRIMVDEVIFANISVGRSSALNWCPICCTDREVRFIKALVWELR